MLQSISINGYEIVMEDEQYNNVLSRAKAKRDKDIETFENEGFTDPCVCPINDYIASIVYEDIGKYFKVRWSARSFLIE